MFKAGKVYKWDAKKSFTEYPLDKKTIGDFVLSYTSKSMKYIEFYVPKNCYHLEIPSIYGNGIIIFPEECIEK